MNQYIFNFFIVFARLSGLFSIAPGLSDERISTKIKLSISILVSICAIPLVQEHLPLYTASSGIICYYMMSEILIGILMGLCLRIIFSSLPILGNIVSMQSGLSAATIYDPSQKEQIALFGSFIISLSLAMIFISDSHHFFIVGFLESYSKITPGVMIDMADASEKISSVVSQSFILAFKIASPFIIVGTSILVGSGILSRLMPTFQVFFVITPIQILIMFMILLMMINQTIFMVIDQMLGTF